jgi:negative regulator of flagellin synthesis FlgM
MKISGNDEIIKYFNDTAVNRTEDATGKANGQKEVSNERGRDAIVDLSQRSREVQLARQAIEAEPDIRLEKVQAIADRVKNGTYEIDYDKTGNKLIAAFLNERL